MTRTAVVAGVGPGLGESMARELGSEGIHVAHVVLDGQILPPDGPGGRDESEFLDPDAIKDTVVVPGRMGGATIDFKADNPGNWFFHCHNLYHLEAGMARVVRYVQ